MSKIIPTVGRVVWYYSNNVDVLQPQPFAATVAYVHSDRMVNLSVIDANGYQFPVQSVPLVQDGEERPQGMYCTWMPYQIGQAAKTAEMAAKVESRTMADQEAAGKQ